MEPWSVYTLDRHQPFLNHDVSRSDSGDCIKVAPFFLILTTLWWQISAVSIVGSQPSSLCNLVYVALPRYQNDDLSEAMFVF